MSRFRPRFRSAEGSAPVEVPDGYWQFIDNVYYPLPDGLYDGGVPVVLEDGAYTLEAGSFTPVADGVYTANDGALVAVAVGAYTSDGTVLTAIADGYYEVASGVVAVIPDGYYVDGVPAPLPGGLVINVATSYTTAPLFSQAEFGYAGSYTPLTLVDPTVLPVVLESLLDS